MKLFVKPIPGFITEGDEGKALVAEDAAGPFWLIGRKSDEELFIWSALQCAELSAPPLLPRGLALLGRYSADASAAAASGTVVAWREEQQLMARMEEKELRDWKVAQPSDLLVRSSLEVYVPPSREEMQLVLSAMARDVSSQLYFRFPRAANSPAQLPSLAQLKAGLAKLGPIPAETLASGDVAVEVLAADLGATCDRANFVDLDTSGPSTALRRVDFAAYVSKDASLERMAEELAEAAKDQFARLEAEVRAGKVANLSVRCYAPGPLGHAVLLQGTEDGTQRQKLHELLRLPEEPLLVPTAAVPPPGQALAQATGKPLNPHNDCGLQPTWWKSSSSKRAFVRGLYEYNHYMQDGFDDNGWGCAYRSLQTCVSWYRMQHYVGTEVAVPSIPDIQRLLKRIDEAHKDLEIGSKKWIGTVEGMYLLQEYLKVDCKMMYCQNCADMASQAPQMLEHLEREGTPIMMGAGMYAYTLVGLCFDSESGEVAYLIVDPHYTGKDDLKPILSKGWVGWKNLDFFEKSTDGSFINCCLPLALGLVLQACRRFGAWEAALQLLDLARNEALSLDSWAYAGAMRACLEPSRSRATAADDAMTLYREFISTGAPTGSGFWITAAAACEEGLLWENAIEILSLTPPSQGCLRVDGKTAAWVGPCLPRLPSRNSTVCYGKSPFLRGA
eukprot:s1453_g3.t1